MKTNSKNKNIRASIYTGINEVKEYQHNEGQEW
jgi:hypothetical protein